MVVTELFIYIFIKDKGCTEGWACRRAPHKYKLTIQDTRTIHRYKTTKLTVHNTINRKQNST